MRSPKQYPIWAWPLAVIGVGILAFFIRADYVLTAAVLQPIRGDAIQYVACAWNLLHHGVFSISPPGSATVVPDSYRDPGFPVILAAWLAIGSVNDFWYAGILYTQAVFGALTVVFTMLIARRWLPAGAALAVGLVSALWPHSVTGGDYLLTEITFGFFCSAALWLLTGVPLSRCPMGRASAAGLIFGLAALTNSILIPFPMAIAVVAFWKRWLPARVVAIFVAAALMLPAAWMIRNLSLPPATSSASRLLINIAQGSYPGFLDGYSSGTLDGSAKEYATLSEEVAASQDRIVQQPKAEIGNIFHRLSESPIRYLRWYLVEKPIALWGWSIRVGQGDIYVYPTQNSPFQSEALWRIDAALARGLNPLIGIAAVMFSLVALVSLCSRRRAVLQVPPGALARDIAALLIIYVTVLYSTLQAEPRYSTAFRGVEIMMAVGTFVILGRRMRFASRSVQRNQVNES